MYIICVGFICQFGGEVAVPGAGAAITMPIAKEPRKPKAVVGGSLNHSELFGDKCMSRHMRQFASCSQPHFKRTLLAVTMASLACSAVAEEALDLGQTVVTASGFEQNLRDAPAAITVISAEELKKKSYTDVTDALKNVAGVQISGGGVEQSIMLRGM